MKTMPVHPVPSTADVVVVGGGVVGLSAAWRLGAAGASVVVVDPAPGHGAGWAAAGMLAPVGEAHFGEEPLVRLALAGAARWPSFAAELADETGLPTGFLATGSLLVGADPSDRAAIEDVLAFQRSLGLDAERLTAVEARTVEPLLAPTVAGGARFPGDHQVDNRLVLAALQAACDARGATFVAARATGVSVDAGRVTGVALEGGSSQPAAAVVVAAGSWSGGLAGLSDEVRPPVRPVHGVTLRLRPGNGTPWLGQVVRGLVHGRPCYIVPRADGSLVVGASAEERGFSDAVPARAVHDLLADARALLPVVDEYELTEASSGLRPGTPDNAPVLGPAGPDGLVLATGHYRNGFLLAPLTADAVAAWVTGTPVPEVARAFGVGRFAAGTVPAAS
jgi:glycine oxidase